MEDKSYIYAKIFSGNYSPEELAWYESEKIARPFEVEQFRKVWDLTANYNYSLNTSTSDSWDLLVSNRNKNNFKPILKNNAFNYFKWSIAAAVVFGLFSFLYFFNKQSSNENMAVNYTVNYECSKGKINTITLADGSIVKLNSGSTLKVDKNFNNKTRSVLLDGEAFFEVSSNINIPFVIEAGKEKVKVVGTSFNISSFKNSRFEIVVKSGVVKVASPKNEIQLVKGQKAVALSNESFIITTVNDDADIVWMNGDFSFDNSVFKEVISEIERHFNVTITYDKKLENKKYTGTFNNKSLEEIIEVLEIVFKTKISQKAASN